MFLPSMIPGLKTGSSEDSPAGMSGVYKYKQFNTFWEVQLKSRDDCASPVPIMVQMTHLGTVSTCGKELMCSITQLHFLNYFM